MSQHSSKGPEWDALRLECLERDDYTCRYCGKTNLTGRDAHADHIIPKSKGGSDTLANLRASCSDCNLRRSDNGEPERVTWFNPRYFTV